MIMFSKKLDIDRPMVTFITCSLARKCNKSLQYHMLASGCVQCQYHLIVINTLFMLRSVGKLDIGGDRVNLPLWPFMYDPQVV